MKIFKSILINFLRDAIVKLALKKLLGNVMAGGFKAWIIKYIALELFDEVLEPLLRLAIRKGMLGVDKIDGAIKVKKITRAKYEDDEATYRNTIGDV